MNIKLYTRNEALKPADCYLVQYRFKNSFRDFRISDCTAVKNVADIPALIEAELERVVSFSCTGEVPDEVDDVADKFGMEIREDADYPGIYIAYIPVKECKVWPLTYGQPLSAATPCIFVDDKLLSGKELSNLKEAARAAVEAVPGVERPNYSRYSK